KSSAGARFAADAALAAPLGGRPGAPVPAHPVGSIAVIPSANRSGPRVALREFVIPFLLSSGVAWKANHVPSQPQ
ncbi:MAG: hypothetical protein WB757_16135, partial [Candidatus Cybelea sp.]